MKHNPLISVIVPTFNRQKTISYCLTSVLAQTYNNLEVIVVDDCSTDNTVAIINDFPDSRLRCIVLEKNSGAQAARNRGIIAAKGEWIAFQDSDDEWLPEKLEKQVAAIATVNYDPWVVVHSNAFRYDPVRKKKKLWLLPIVEGVDQYSSLFKSPAPLYPTILVSKIALEKIEYLDENVPSYQELDTSIRLAKYCKFIHIKDPLMIYHIGDSHAISGDALKNIEGWYYNINKHEGDIKKFCGEEAWQKLVIQLLRRCLNFGLTEHYDRYRSRLAMSNNDLFEMVYLILCRKFCVSADNMLYRFTLKIYHIFKKYRYLENLK